MKKLSLLLTILLFSQMAQAQGNDGSYVALWKKVQKLESEALTKSALKVVDSISKKAKKDKNGTVTEMLMIVLEADEAVVMSMSGLLDMKTISEISKSLEIDGMEGIYQMNKDK